MKRALTYILSAIWLLFLAGCATPRKQTCPPRDTRCHVWLLISTLDIDPSGGK